MKAITTIFKSKSRNKSGFTLVETLVAITILVLALTGPLVIISQALKSSYFSRDEITAAYLAQEPIEFIRNIRDQNTLRSSNSSFWLKSPTSYDLTVDNNNNPLFSNSGSGQPRIPVGLVWDKDLKSFRLQKCFTSDDCRVSFDRNASTNGKVVYGSTEPGLEQSIYTRTIYLTKAESDQASFDPLGLAPDRELVITVVVTWTTGGVSHNITITENLFNWQLENES